MRNAQPAQALSATSFYFSSGRNGGRYGALRERLLPCRQTSQTRMPTFDLAVEGRQSIIQAMRYFIDLRIVKLCKEC